MSDILTLLVPAGTAPTLAQEAQQTLAHHAQITGIEIRSPADEQFLVDVRSHVHERLKALDSQRKTITGPLDQAKKAVDALFKPAKDAYEEIKDLISSKLTEAETTRREAEREARKALAGTFTPEAPAVARPEGVIYVEEWELESASVVELAKTSQGQGYLCVDLAGVRTMLKLWKSSEVPPVVQGLTFRKVSKVRQR